jgi:hypothetical protein
MPLNVFPDWVFFTLSHLFSMWVSVGKNLAELRWVAAHNLVIGIEMG